MKHIARAPGTKTLPKCHALPRLQRGPRGDLSHVAPQSFRLWNRQAHALLLVSLLKAQAYAKKLISVTGLIYSKCHVSVKQSSILPKQSRNYHLSFLRGLRDCHGQAISRETVAHGRGTGPRWGRRGFTQLSAAR